MNTTEPPRTTNEINARIDALLQSGGRYVHGIVTSLLDICAESGASFTTEQIQRMVVRAGDSVSRMGINALGTLYSHHLDAIKALNLPQVFAGVADGRLSYYCQLREDHPDANMPTTFIDEDNPFRIGEWQLTSNRRRMFDHFMSRGESVLLDYATRKTT
jgi:hypothetical protein